MQLTKPKNTTPAASGRARTPKSAGGALDVANLIAPFIMGGGIGVLRSSPPKFWRRLSPYAKAMALASLGETARRRGLRETAGACFALGAEMAAEHAARQVKANKAAKSTEAPATGDGQASGRLPVPVGGQHSDVDAVIRAQAMGQLPTPIGPGAPRVTTHSYLDDLVTAASA